MKLTQRDMMSATELTRSGKLAEATALIQKMLGFNRSSNADHDVDIASPIAPTIKKLARKASPADVLKVATSAKPKPKSSSAHFVTKDFASTHGKRSYKLFTPSQYEGQPLPLVVMLHGCSQSPDDFAVGTNMNVIAEEIGFFVAYPEQPSSANAMGCWNWFKSSDQKKDSGEPALITGIVREVIADHAVNQQKVYVAGLSAGGAMAAILGMTHPNLFAAIGVHSGLPCGAATSMVGAFNAMKRGGSRVPTSTSLHPVPTIVFHGDKDRTVDQVNSDDVIAQFDTTGAFNLSTTETGKSAGGMEYSRLVYLQENGSPLFEQWMVHGAGHAWSGGSTYGTYTEPRGPDASREMIRFFFEHKLSLV